MSGYRTVYRGPNREVLVGGPLPGGAEDDRLWESLVHPDDRERWRAAVGHLPEGKPIELEYRVIGLDGRERTILDPCARAAKRTARCSTTASRATSPSASGCRASSIAPTAKPSCAPAPTS